MTAYAVPSGATATLARLSKYGDRPPSSASRNVRAASSLR
jgi:hypothetical protein